MPLPGPFLGGSGHCFEILSESLSVCFGFGFGWVASGSVLVLPGPALAVLAFVEPFANFRVASDGSDFDDQSLIFLLCVNLSFDGHHNLSLLARK